MPGKSKKILLVEDDPALRKVTELKLKNAGLEVKVAENGDEALEILVKEKVDLVMTDLIMPNRDGFSVLEDIKERNIDVPVVVQSLLGNKEDLKRAKELGATDYFVKSKMSITEMVDRIKKLASTT